MSDSTITELEFSGFPRKRESVSRRCPSGGGHKSRNETQPFALVSGAAFSRTAGTRRGTGFFSWQWQHVGSLPAAAGHRWELQKHFYFSDSSFTTNSYYFIQKFMKSRKWFHLVGLSTSSTERSNSWKTNKSSSNQRIALFNEIGTFITAFTIDRPAPLRAISSLSTYAQRTFFTLF